VRLRLATCVLLACCAGLTAAAADANEFPTGAGAITVTSREQLSPRLSEFKLTTPALASETIVRVLLPRGYAQHPTTRYPVLYLLNGCCDYDVDGAQAWTTHGEAEQATDGVPLIVVMPAGGRGGFYTDWYNNGAFGQPAYETYHLGELVPWVDQQFRTVGSRSGRAIAGLSMGGFGAMSYAGRHPDMFVSASSFSGAVDIMDPVLGGEADALPMLDNALPMSAFGPRLTEEARWRAHNPVDLAGNLRGLSLTIRTGNGMPGGEYGGGPDPVEAAVHQQSTTLHNRLVALGIPHTWEDYGPGAHQWPYWARDLRLTLPQLMQAFRDAGTKVRHRRRA
jgi:S-formylglutathione hydrolase FrmB